MDLQNHKNDFVDKSNSAYISFALLSLYAHIKKRYQFPYLYNRIILYHIYFEYKRMQI